jgi:hypothetical protein
MTEKPFDNSDEASNWITKNCTDCDKRVKCDIYYWILNSYALFGTSSLNGDIPYEIARNMGFYERGDIRLFPCKIRK